MAFLVKVPYLLGGRICFVKHKSFDLECRLDCGSRVVSVITDFVGRGFIRSGIQTRWMVGHATFETGIFTAIQRTDYRTVGTSTGH